MSTSATGNDPLAEIDKLMRTQRDEDQESADRAAQVLADRSEFSDEFARVCDVQVRPAMEAVIERLRQNGGGGVIEERAEDLARNQAHRLTLWMSFSGEIVGTPRPDRHPYLQLDATVAKRVVTVSEGDMWQGRGGGRSGKAGEWKLSEITAALVTETILEVIRRAFH
jgi:hypothetical protein